MSARFSGQGGVGGGRHRRIGRAVSLACQKESAQVVVTYQKQEEFDVFRNAEDARGSRLKGHRMMSPMKPQ